jgi:hypothetical protein
MTEPVVLVFQLCPESAMYRDVSTAAVGRHCDVNEYTISLSRKMNTRIRGCVIKASDSSNEKKSLRLLPPKAGRGLTNVAGRRGTETVVSLW